MYAQSTSVDKLFSWTGFGFGGTGAGNAHFNSWFNLSSVDNSTIPLNVAAAWKLQAELVLNTPNRIGLESFDDQGFAVIAGAGMKMDSHQNMVQVLLNNYQLDYDIVREIAAQTAPYINTSTAAYPLIQENGRMSPQLLFLYEVTLLTSLHAVLNGEEACFVANNSLVFIPGTFQSPYLARLYAN